MADPRAWVQGAIDKITQETPEVRTFRVVKPNGDKFDFMAGQFYMLQFADDPKTVRAYSVASSPADEGYIEVTLNKVGKFTTRLFNLSAPASIMIRGPFGKFVMDTDKMKHIVCIAGGTGITPFRSMTRYIIQKGLPNRATISYSVRVPSEIIYHKEFEELAAQHKNVTFYATVTRPHLMPPGTAWNGPTGRLSAATFQKIIPDFKEAYYFICGSNELIDNLSGDLVKAGVGQDHVIFEKWG